MASVRSSGRTGCNLSNGSDGTRFPTQKSEQLSEELFIALDEEKRKIASDLHDGIGQSLSVIGFALQELNQQIRLRLSDTEQDRFEWLMERVALTLEDVRRVSVRLHPPALDNTGIVNAIASLCEDLRCIDSEIEITQQIHAIEDDIPAKVKPDIFRITQEACHNALEHAQARRVTVLLESDAEGIRLEVVDDGIGFNQAHDQSCNKRFGLTSIRERVELTGGCLTIRSQSMKGTSVLATWPPVETNPSTPALDSTR